MDQRFGQQGEGQSQIAIRIRGQQFPSCVLLVVRIDADGIPTGGTERSIITQEGTWNRLTQQLTLTPPGEPNRLPWEASFAIDWRGEVAGPLLEAGVEYALWLKVVDGDGNESLDTPDSARAGLWSSLNSFQLLGE